MPDRTTPRSGGPPVVSLTDPEALDPALVGAKGANLARLVAAGIPVPEAFCVTTVVYRDLIDDGAIRDRIDGLSDLDPTDTAAIASAGGGLRDRIRERDLPPSLRAEIERAMAGTEGGLDGSYAVRSSATAEDLPEASFAGQQETFLNVRGVDEVVDRVRACAASLFTDRAIAYRARNGIEHAAVAIAVVVQRMVDPEISGVLFTADPATGNRRVATIEAVRGLGEAIVSGEVTGDSVRVDRRSGRILEYEPGDQRVAIRPLREGGTERVELSPHDRRSRALSDEQVSTLVEIGGRIEALFGTPQDVEWCLGDGGLSVVQSRPITSLFPLPSPRPSDDGLHVYYSVGHAQAFPEAMPPLVRDVWLTYVESAFAAYGASSEARLGVEAGGRVYVDLTPLLRVDVLRGSVPELLAEVSEPMGAALDDLLSRRGDEFRTDRSLRETLRALPEIAGAVGSGVRVGLPIARSSLGGFLGAFVGEPNPPTYEEALWTEWGRKQAAEVSRHETLRERARAPFDPALVTAAIRSIPRTGPLFAALVVDGWLRRRFSESPEDVNAVGRGFPDELVTRINLGLGDLADVAHEHPVVVDALRAGASIDEIATLEGGDAFVAAVDAYLDEFGHRATGELDLSRPRWREDPSGLLAAVGADLEHGDAGEHREHIRRLKREADEAAKRLERRVDVGLFGPARKWILRRILATYRGYVQTREYPKQGSAYLFEAWRQAILEAGERLADDGRIDRRDDVWFLRKDELFAALDGEPIDVDVASCRSEFERHASMDAPPILTSEGEAPSPRVEREDIPEGALVGTGASGGVVEGVARVVRDPSRETIEKGEILVAPSSDPGWTPLFLNAAGMVVEVGGRISHGALVAREYGIPAVVSVPGVTRKIRTGERIRVDGTRGIVERIE